MEDKKQDVNSLEELVKTADSYRAFFANLADELSKVLADIQTSKKEEDTWKMKCPYKYGDEYWNMLWGRVKKNTWDWIDCERTGFEAGEIFPTEEAAELELKRRKLLTRFRAFRNECNDGWVPDWSGTEEMKAYIQYHEQFNKFVIKYTLNRNILQTFGFFKCKQDAERAVELFGDEIKELFVECDA